MNDHDGIALFQRRVGNTPLLRCKALEGRLGLSEVYAKLEGTNPTGHKSDRIAHRVIRDARQGGFSTVTMGTVGYMAKSLSTLTDQVGIQCVFFVPTVTDGMHEWLGDSPHVRVMETGGTLEDAITESREQAERHGWYNANPGLQNTLFGMTAYSPIASELVRRLGGPPDSIFMPVGTGSLLSGIHLGLRQMWSYEEIDSVPPLFGGGINGVNAIIEAFERGLKEVEPLDVSREGMNPDLYTLINLQGFMGQPALEAILDTGGGAYSFTEGRLTELQGMFNELENVELTVDSASAVGALTRAHEDGLLAADGRHVVVLSTGRTDLTIEELTRGDLGPDLDWVIELLDGWLHQFSDPEEEILEALENALDQGYVLGAVLDHQLVGLCVLSTMELDTFFPRYHLSYIAADDSYEGRGVATQLIEQAVEVSGGNLSLHVERDNDKAIRLYQKMGFDIKYHRMQYMGGSGE